MFGRALARFTVTGEIPAAGVVLLIVDHAALVDGPMRYGVLPRPVAFLVKAEVSRGPLASCCGAPARPGTRRKVDSAPLRAASEVLAAGGAAR